MKKNYFIFSLVFFPILLIAQTSWQYEIGLPLICNHPPKEYKAFSQNWGCVQDSRGVLYFANGDGVLEFDGAHWRVIRIANKSSARSVAIDIDDKIYVGSASEFGYLATSKTGGLKYVSLLNKFDPKNRKFNYILNIYIVKSGVYFMAGEKLFRWNKNLIKAWNLHNPGKCYKFGENIFLWQKNTGLGYIWNDSIVKLKGGEYFAQKSIQNILPFKGNKMLIVTKDSGMFLVNDPYKLKKSIYPEIIKFNNQADYFIHRNILLNSTKLKNGNYAFTTHRSGTAIMDNKGNLISILNKKAGVQNETHSSVFQDNQNSLWLSLDNGITRADISSPLSFWNDDMGLKGSVLSCVRFKGKIFAGTWQGLFYHDFSLPTDSVYEDDQKTDLSHFKSLKDIKSTTWDLLVIKNKKNRRNDKLIVASSAGVFDVNLYSSNPIIEKVTALILFRSEKDPSRIFVGTNEGIICISLNYSGDELIFKNEGKLDGIDEKIVSINEDNTGKLWVSTEFSGVYMVKFKNRYTQKNTLSLNGKLSYNITRFDTASGLPSSYSTIYKFRNKLLFVSEDGIYLPVEKLNGNKVSDITFVRKNFLSVGFPERSLYINRMIEDKRGNLWLQITNKVTGKKTLVAALKNKNGAYTINTIAFKPIPQMEIYSIYPEETNVTWFGGDDGLYRYDGNVKYAYNQEFHALIRKVILERDSVLFGGTYFKNINDSGECVGLSLDQPENLKPEISFAYNSLTFEYAAPSYYDESSKQYKIFLEGFDKKWSDWTNETKKGYTNLPPGVYKFHVISKNIFDTDSTEALYEFKILSPWYRTYLAYVFYVLAFAFIIYSAIRYSNKRLREAKLRLEEVVKERTNEINNQKKELEKEKEKSDKLLLNILPFKIAQELKADGSAKAKFFDQVTVMFSDFKDFTVIAQQLEPQELVSELNRCFVFFDDVCVRHNIEKIKTVGDSYMCAGGLPIKNKTNPIDMVLAAFEIRDFINRLKKEQSDKRRTLWKIRIGIHTGKIISGVVGKKKFAYDIWGDTVNTASRLEQSGLPNKINISGLTYELVKDFFECTYRGKVPVKHKGEIDMYFAERIKKELSVDVDGKIPNQKFEELYEKISQ
ncbi:MAG: adenylate/guanylate cyclase domain-containing protein [Bacteroidales bacterium]